MSELIERRRAGRLTPMESSSGGTRPDSSPLLARRSWNTSLALVLAGVFAAFVFEPLWRPLLLALVLAASVSDAHRRVSRSFGGRRSLAAGVLTAGMLLVILGPLFALLIIGIKQAVLAYEWVQKLLRAGAAYEIIRPLPDNIERWVRPQLERLPKVLTSLPSGTGEAGRWAAVQMQSAVATVSEVAFDLAMMSIAFFFLLADGERLVAWLKSVSPLGRSRTEELVVDFRLVARSLVGSNLITGLAQAVVATIGYVISGTPQPVFFGLLTFLTSFIPTVGTSIVALPLAGILLLTGKPWAALFLAGWALGVVALVDNLLRPWLIKGEVHVHGAVVFFALVGGILLFGFIGLVIGPIALMLFLTLLRFHERDLRAQAALPGPDVPSSAPLP